MTPLQSDDPTTDAAEDFATDPAETAETPRVTEPGHDPRPGPEPDPPVPEPAPRPGPEPDPAPQPQPRSSADALSAGPGATTEGNPALPSAPAADSGAPRPDPRWHPDEHPARLPPAARPARQGG